jgi:hypothetical protein
MYKYVVDLAHLVRSHTLFLVGGQTAGNAKRANDKVSLRILRDSWQIFFRFS